MNEEPCCSKAEDVLEYRCFDNFSGPEEEGWTIPLYDNGDVYFELVQFCPFCGQRIDHG